MRTSNRRLYPGWGLLLGFAVATMVWPGSVAEAGEPGVRELRVSVMRGDRWVPVGALSLDRFQSTRTLVLPVVRSGADVRVRLEKRGGGLAHVDAVSLAGRAPLGVTGAPLAKVSIADDDVADATHRPLTLLFAGSDARRPVLSVRARIEPSVIGKLPFLYPPENTGRPMTADRAFYRYRLGSRPGRLQVDGEVRGESLGRPFFAEQRYVNSGHPQGTTYGWVSDDGRTLYVAMDFTSDNTVDGELDYATVFARVNGELRTFRVTQSQRRWGVAGFTYTRRVRYQHKVYELAIPLSELGPGARTGQVVELAFAAYGTASPGAWETQTLAFEPNSRTFAYRHWPPANNRTSVQLYDHWGNELGGVLQVDLGGGYNTSGGIAADVDAGRFLVTFDDGGVNAQLVDPATGLWGSALLVSDNLTGTAEGSRVAYDSDQGRYLVVWIDSRSGSDELRGRFVNADGTMPAASFFIDDSQMYANGGRVTPNLAYSSVSGQFLVANVRNDSCEAWLLDGATGTTVGTVITLAAWQVGLPGCVYPDVAYEPSSDVFLAAWQAGQLRSRIVHADGATEPTQDVGGGLVGYRGVAVAGQERSSRFLVTATNTDNELVGSFVSSVDGLPEGSLLPLHFGPAVVADWPGVAANPLNGSFAVTDYNLWDHTSWITVLPTLEATPAFVTTSEMGGTDTIEVALVHPPTGDVRLLVTTSDPAEATVDPTVLHFDVTNYGVAQTITVQGVDDSVPDGDLAYDVVLTVDDASSAVEFWHLGASIPGVNLNDDYGLDVTQAPLVTGEDGAAVSFDISLPAPPAGQVVIDITVSDDTEAMVDTMSLTFDATNAGQPRQVTVTGVDDADCDGDVAFTVDLAVRNSDSDVNFHDLAVSLDGTNVDDEPVSCDPVCGDGTRDANEACDDGNTTDGDGCSANCELESLCGNGEIDELEQCDDANTVGGDGCDELCQVEDGWSCSDRPSYCEEDESGGCACHTHGNPTTPPLLILLAFGLMAWLRRRSRYQQ